MPTTTAVTPEILAQQLENVWQGKIAPVQPFSETGQVTSTEEAYKVQTHWTKIRLKNGDKILGRKIGLTSKAMQEQLGVNEPDYGSLWGSRFYDTKNGQVDVPFKHFLQPRVEGEIAFLIGKKIQGPNVTPQQVLEATKSLAVAVEIIDSRIEKWRIKIIDTVADNASYGGFATGAWSTALLKSDLPALKMTTHVNGTLATEGLGAAVMGHPANAAAWLINKLSSFGVSLEPGDVVLSGSLAKATPVKQGDKVVFAAGGEPPLNVNFV